MSIEKAIEIIDLFLNDPSSINEDDLFDAIDKLQKTFKAILSISSISINWLRILKQEHIQMKTNRPGSGPATAHK